MSDLAPMAMITGTEAFDQASSRWAELKTARSQHEADWAEIARLMRPHLGGFTSGNTTDHHAEKPLSSVPVHAADAFAAGLYGTMTNPANRWFGLATNDEDLNAWQPGKVWRDQVTTRLLASFGPAISPYYSTAVQTFGTLATLGNSAEYDELVPEENKIMDVAVPLAEVVYDIDSFGRVCEVVRQFRLKPGAALRMFAKRGRLPPRVLEMAEKQPNSKITFYHHVLRNDDWMPGRRIGARGKAWLSRYSCEVERSLVREAGYDDMPFYAVRWQVETGQTYAYGPGFVALAAARAHNLMDAAVLRAAQQAADPTLLAPDREDWPLNGRVRPGSVLYGGVDTQGRQMVHPLALTGSIGLTLQDRQVKAEEIKDAFHYTLLQLVGRTGMTATEVLAIQEERQRLWAPHQGRVQEEYLARKIQRRFMILWRAGQLPPPPPEMSGAALTVEYQSAAAAAQRSGEGLAARRLLQDLGPLAQMMPRVLERIDPDGLVEVLADAGGVPGRMLRSRDSADQIAAQRQQQEQMAQALQAAQQGAGALKDAASAGALMAQGQGAGA